MFYCEARPHWQTVELSCRLSRGSGVPAELLLNIWNLTTLISLMILLSIWEFLSQCCISTDGHGFAKVYLGTDLPRKRAKPLGLLRFGGKNRLDIYSTLFQRFYTVPKNLPPQHYVKSFSFRSK